MNNKMDNKMVNHVGGFLSFGKPSFDKTIKKTRSSETTLIKQYKAMDKATKKYQGAYKKHLKNLETLDDYAGFKGMEELFQKVIMKDNLKKDGDVDKNLPILLHNYLTTKGMTPSAFRKEHILRQVDYILERYFPGKDQMFIKTKDAEIGKYEFILEITTIENIKKSRKITHSNYVISFSETKAFLKEVVGIVKKNLKRESSVMEMDSRARSSSVTVNNNDNNRDVSKLASVKGSPKKTKTATGSAGNLLGLLDSASGKSGKSKKSSTTKHTLPMFLTGSEIKKRATPATPAVAAAPGAAVAVPMGLANAKEQLAAATPGAPYAAAAAPAAGDKAAMCAGIPNPSIGTCKPAGCWFDENLNKCVEKGQRPPRPPGPYQTYGAPQGPAHAFGAAPAPSPNPAAAAPMETLGF